MSRINNFIIIAIVVVLAVAGVTIFLVSKSDVSDNSTEYEFRPLTEDQLKTISESSTATSSESLLEPEEQTAVEEASTASSSGSLLTSEEEEALRNSMDAPNR